MSVFHFHLPLKKELWSFIWTNLYLLIRCFVLSLLEIRKILRITNDIFYYFCHYLPLEKERMSLNHLDNLESPQKIETLCVSAIHLLKIASHFSEQTHFKLSIAITQGKIKALIFSVSIQVQRIQELLKNWSWNRDHKLLQ